MPVLKIKFFDVILRGGGGGGQKWKFPHLTKWKNAGSNFRSEHRNKSLNFLPIFKNKVSLFLLLHAPWDEAKYNT